MSGPEERLRESWVANADAWTDAVREQRIASRRLVTDDAIVAGVLERGGSTLLDIGCGEGWLARRLSAEGLEVIGFDGSERLIEHARALGGGTFVVASYDDFVADPHAIGRDFDVAVANFSLFAESPGDVLVAARQVVAPHGALVIQTVHGAAGDTDGWREERYEPLAPLPFTPMPWYFRTVPSWLGELERAGWPDVEVREPLDPRTGEPASVVLVARKDVLQAEE